MKELELKHLAGYLPYGLKALCVRTNEVRAVTLLHFTYDLTTVGHNHLLYEGSILEKHKPILRPLSDLTKEIEVNGEKFVPIEIAGNGRIEMFALSKNQASIQFISFGTIQKLYEWHFDIYGLIENNLAIDFNTL